MKYKVVPLQHTQDVPSLLQEIIDSASKNGWEYVNHQYSDKLYPGKEGCFGIGSTPDTTIHVGVVIFKKED